MSSTSDVKQRLLEMKRGMKLNQKAINWKTMIIKQIHLIKTIFLRNVKNDTSLNEKK